MLIKKPNQSLRTILMVWFLLFSIVPLTFITGVMFIKYKDAINYELLQRLQGNIKGIDIIFRDFENSLSQLSKKNAQDTSLIYYLSTGSENSTQRLVTRWMKSSQLSSRISVFNRTGRLMVTTYRDDFNEVRSETSTQLGEILLSEKMTLGIKNKNQIKVVDFGKNNLIMVVLTKVLTKSNRLAGYIEQTININKDFLTNLKKRLEIEALILNPSGKIVSASHPDLEIFPENYFLEKISNKEDEIFDVVIRDKTYGFIIQNLKWGESEFSVSIGTSKEGSKELIRSLYLLFFFVLGTIIILLVATTLVVSRVIVKPLNDLLDATEHIHEDQTQIQMPVTSSTEIGVLTESFNEMAQKVSETRRALKDKISELEKTNIELKETQAKLVHSAKMVSLGQLVAGVAHELNNPISFIYSNLNYLKEYSNKLIDLNEIDDKIARTKKKKEIEYDYLLKDMPKLIRSCEEGSRRIRDIVIGLRNFSRLEEAKIKRVDLQDGIEGTLNLLQGEIKSRIQVHKEYGEIPEIICYPSQLNQVFMNILSNAVQAIEGEGEIWIQTSLEKNKQGIEGILVSIKDTGRGIAPSALEQIFDPFYTTKEVGQGTGLGLSISYGIIEDHGGDIQVNSELGKGTEFKIFLPLNFLKESI